FGLAVEVEVGGPDADTAGEAGEGEETGELAAVQTAEDLDMPTGRPGISTDDDIVEAIAVDITRGHVDAAGVAGEGEEAADGPGDLRAGEAGKVLAGAAGSAGAGAGDEVGPPVARDIAGRHAPPAPIAAIGLHAKVHLPGEAVEREDSRRW